MTHAEAPPYEAPSSEASSPEAPSSTAWFDAECRLGRGKLHQPGAPVTVDELLSELEANAIDRALVYHADAVGYDPAVGNQRLLREVVGVRKLVPCWVLLPHETGEMDAPHTLIEAMLDAGVRAARLFPRDFGFAFRVWNLAPLLEQLALHRIPLWVDFGHQGWGEEAIDFTGVHEVCDAFPELPVVLVRPNIGSNRRLFPLMRRHRNLHIETSYYTVHRGIELVCQTFGPKRVLFGSGLPHRAPGPTITALTYSLIDDEARALVAGGNLTRLLAAVV